MDDTQVSAAPVADTTTTQTENPTISQAAQQAVTETSQVNQPAQQTPAAPVNPAPAPNTSTQDSFTTFDPSQLTDPNLQAAYKQMQADYTKKMQEVSTQRQQFAKYEQMMPVLDQMLSSQQNQLPQNPVWPAIERQLKEAGYSDEYIDAAKIQNNTEYQYRVAEQQQQAQIASITKGIDEASTLDERLNDQSLTYDLGEGQKATFGEIVERLVSATPGWQNNVKGATQNAIRTVDAMINAAKTQGKEELSNQAKAKAQTFQPVQTSPQGAAPANEALDLRSAIEAARKEVGM